jgi:hypothetical protein
MILSENRYPPFGIMLWAEEAPTTTNPGVAAPGFCIPKTEIGGQAVYSCPYLWSTARQSLETRQLWAASVAPQRIRLLHVMPPERSHILAAAGLHGASSARSIALAAVAVRPMRMHAATIVFMLGSIPLCLPEAPCLPAASQEIQQFCASHNTPKMLATLT